MVTLYTQPGCGPCAGAKAFLEAAGVEFQVLDITVDHASAERLRQNGFTGTPVIGYAGHLYTVDRLVDVVREERERLAFAGHWTA